MDDLKVKSLVDRCTVLTSASERWIVSTIDRCCSSGKEKDLILEWFYMIKENMDELSEELR